MRLWHVIRRCRCGEVGVGVGDNILLSGVELGVWIRAVIGIRKTSFFDLRSLFFFLFVHRIHFLSPISLKLALKQLELRITIRSQLV